MGSARRTEAPRSRAVIIPFGYRMDQGIVHVDEGDGQAVRDAYAARLRNLTLGELAEDLNNKGIPFRSDIPWDKHRMKRLLEDSRYTGEDGYPAIITRELYDEVQRLRLSKRAGHERIPPHIALVKGKTRCRRCGEPVLRDTKAKRRFGQRWYCKNKECRTWRLTDTQVLDAIAALLSQRLELPKPVRLSDTEGFQERIREDTNRLRSNMKRRDSEPQDIHRMIRARAQALYEMCRGSDRMYSKALLAQSIHTRKAVPEFNRELFEELVESVLIGESGEIALLLCDGSELAAHPTEEEEAHYDADELSFLYD